MKPLPPAQKSRVFFMSSLAVVCLGMCLCVGLAGCESEEAQQFIARGAALAADDDHPLPDDGFDARVTLCRKVGKKTGKRIGIATSFQIAPWKEGQKAKKQYVNGVVDFENVEPGRVYPVHLVWIKPGGKEMFRKYAEVEVTEVEGTEVATSYQTQIRWLKAEFLHYLKEKTVESDEPTFSLSARLNISADKAREPGTYMFRVYLDRRLLIEEPFEVTQG